MKRMIGAIMLGVLAASTGARADISPYAGEDIRPIKALSAEEIEGLLRGDGLGTALPDELNHYPGPRHVLQLKDSIALTPEQTATARRLEAAMTDEAKSLGGELIANEAALEALFASGRADDAGLEILVTRSAELRGQLRLTHLVYHLRMRELLSAHQVALYDRLRGYAGEPPAGHGHHHGP